MDGSMTLSGFQHPELEKLTVREKEIIELILGGYSSNEIANSLFISKHTVSTHRKNIKRKMGKKLYSRFIYASLVIKEVA